VDVHREAIESATTTLDDVDRALDRLSDGTYRSCEACGDELTDEQLAAAPTRRRCAAHAGAEFAGPELSDGFAAPTALD
jgi:RNA polymerase-binding transcription factor DksA